MSRKRTADTATQDIKGKTLPKFSEIHKRKWGIVRDLGARGNKIIVNWDLNDDAHRRQIFELKFNGQSAFISKQELEHYIRDV